MPAVAKKSVKVTSSKSDDVAKKPKKQNSKKLQKTVEINAAKKLAKLKSTKAVSDKLNRAPAVRRQKASHQFDPKRLKRGVVLVQNLPKGFFEKELKKYFTQYGRVTRLRLARSERTGGSKGYAFIEFKHPEVAKVAAETMNDYLMFRQRLKTVYISPEEQDHDYFKQPVKFVRQKNGKVKVHTPTTLRAVKAVAKYNKPVTTEVQAERVERSKYKLNFLQKKLAKAGINVDLSSQLYEAVEAPKASQPEVSAKKNKKVVESEVPAKKSKKVVESSQPEVQAKKSKKVVESSLPETPKPEKSKVRKNFVSAPTPESVKPIKKSKPVVEAKKSKKIVESSQPEVPAKKTKKVVESSQPEVPAKKSKKVVESSLPATPKPKVRKNFVSAPTPESVKPIKKTKPVVEKIQNSTKAKKITKATEQTKTKKSQNIAEVKKAINKKNTQPKKALNKKK